MALAILEFAFDSNEDNDYLPHNYEKNAIVYTGTHDNDTLIGLIEDFNEWDKNNFYNGVKNSLKAFKLKNNIDNVKSLANAVIELGFCSKSKLFILPVQDMLLKDGSYRINQPGTVKNQNWAIKFDKGDISVEAFSKLKRLTKKYNR